MNILVFPCGLPAALGFLPQALEKGDRCIGASSLVYDPSAAAYEAWERLPWVGETNFAAALLSAVDRYNITQVFSAHPAVAVHLRDVLREYHRQIAVIEPHEDVVRFEKPSDVLARAERMLDCPICIQPSGHARLPLTAFEFAGLLRQASFIEGSTDEIKIEALCEAARWAPAGDVVEIGSAYGKSAFVLAWLTAHFGLGHLLCVDPWNDALPIESAAAPAVREWARRLNRAEMFRSFTLSLIPWAAGCGINYLRLTSDRAWDRWIKNGFSVESPEFGITRYAGRISILHVDGNHDLEWAARDINWWGQLLLPGGWLIVDDYRWAFGSGPREAADAWLVEKSDEVDCLFEAGSSLFIRLKSSAAAQRQAG